MEHGYPAPSIANSWAWRPPGIEQEMEVGCLLCDRETGKDHSYSLHSNFTQDPSQYLVYVKNVQSVTSVSNLVLNALVLAILKSTNGMKQLTSQHTNQSLQSVTGSNVALAEPLCVKMVPEH